MGKDLLEEISSIRKKKIFEAVVVNYIATAEPVGSRKITKQYNIDLSPASVRNIMADLEELGLLTQIHSSSGRIPTEKGYRVYVDNFLEVKELTGTEREGIKDICRGSVSEFSELLKGVSKTLSFLSHYAGVVLAPKFNTAIVEHVEFIKLGFDQILALFVLKGGFILKKTLKDEDDLSQQKLDRLSDYLNNILKGLTLYELKKKITEELNKQRNEYNELFCKALELTREALKHEGKEDLYIEGATNILDYPEFSDIEKMKSLFKAFDEKSILLKLLDKVLTAGGTQIFIGFENELKEMQGCSLVASPYGVKEQPLGTLGVIGPTRMDYSKVISMVNYTAKVLTHILSST